MRASQQGRFDSALQLRCGQRRFYRQQKNENNPAESALSHYGETIFALLRGPQKLRPLMRASDFLIRCFVLCLQLFIGLGGGNERGTFQEGAANLFSTGMPKR
jgi:hypothetical protein